MSCNDVTINGQNVETLKVFLMGYSDESAHDMTINCPVGINTTCLIKSDSDSGFWYATVNADDTDTLIMIGNAQRSFEVSDIRVNNARNVYIDCSKRGCSRTDLYIGSVCIICVPAVCISKNNITYIVRCNSIISSR